MSKTEKVGQQVGVSVLFDTVTVEVICGDEYAAQVLYDDVIDRLQRGEGITLSLEQPAKAVHK